MKPEFLRHSRYSILGLFGLVVLAQGCSASVPNTGLSNESLNHLKTVAARTWDYLAFSLNSVSGFPADHVNLDQTGHLKSAEYTTTTNVGMMLLAILAAQDFGFISQQEERRGLSKILTTLEKMPKSHGLFYNYFQVQDGAPDPKRYVSSVDNAWLAAGLWAVSQSGSSQLRKKARDLYAAMDFSACYDPSLGQFRLGYSEASGEQSPYHYGLLCSEARLVSLIAIAKGQVPEEHWYKIFRTLPKDHDWQNQEPKGQNRVQAGVDYFSGYYEVAGEKVVPSWGGSLFEFLAPLLLVPEMEVAPYSFKLNHERVVKLHKAYCLEEKKYPVWGLSPSAMPVPGHEFKYGEFGDARLGTKGYPDKGVVTPYAAFLALEIDPAGVVENSQNLQKHFPDLWTEYGFYDAVNVQSGQVAQVYLTLDQAMIFLAVHNFLKQGATRQRFFRGEIERKIKPILREEIFYEGGTP